MSTAVSSRLLAAAVHEAHTQLDTAHALDVSDALAVVRSQASLAAALRWVLWALDEEWTAADTAADIPNQVAAEDGVRTIGVPYQRTGQVAA
ncbi:hypothetical protein ACIPJG_33530 [Streptomyces halstedii]|uniref:hypothetical protein n=1 Tax=Streptomyces halstedii TaxID=1944 RepID=UPI00380BBF32